ncbi:MAG: response regulator transcription factor [Hyphomicrobiales bacterium]
MAYQSRTPHGKQGHAGHPGIGPHDGASLPARRFAPLELRHLGQPVVLLVDDDRSLLRLLTLELNAQGFQVIAAEPQDEVLRLVTHYHPDVVVVDQLLGSGMDGLELMRMIHSHERMPVLVMSGLRGVPHRVRALELGADDFLEKPINSQELAARIRAVLRRRRSQAQSVLQYHGLRIDLGRGRVWQGSEPIELTATEWELLRYFAANQGRVIEPGEMLSKVWGPAYREQVHHVRVWVSRLRHKLELDPAEPRVIRTVVGLGYLMEPPDDEASPTGTEG